jgi:porphobilinogen synthase
MEKNIYPLTQRRYRANDHIRSLTAGVRLSHQAFIQPLFVDASVDMPRYVEGLNEVRVDSLQSVIETIAADLEAGVSKFLLFPVPANKSADKFDYSFAVNTVKNIKAVFGDQIWLASDVCLCSYTSHGHCGILNKDATRLLNNPTVQELSKYASLLADAGIDCIAPSDMMDGRIAAIRASLDVLGYDDISIMSYAAKFSSQLYGPFREACHSAPKTDGLKNRKTYQMDAANLNDAIASALRDEKEGADILMVKPAALYTDVIKTLKQQTLKPLAAYHVSGEYAAVELLAEKGMADRAALHLEVWTALVRSGADIVISYAARYAKQWIEEKKW